MSARANTGQAIRRSEDDLIPIELTRQQVVAYRRRVSAFNERMPAEAASLQQAAWAGLRPTV